MLILNFELDSWNSDPNIHFWGNLGRKSQSCLFCLNFGTHVISRILILILTLVFWISFIGKPKFIYWQIWAEKVKVLNIDWKFAHRVPRQCRLLFRHYFSQFPTQINFWANLGWKSQSCLFFQKIGTRTHTHTHTHTETVSRRCWFLLLY